MSIAGSIGQQTVAEMTPRTASCQCRSERINGGRNRWESRGLGRGRLIAANHHHAPAGRPTGPVSFWRTLLTGPGPAVRMFCATTIVTGVGGDQHHRSVRRFGNVLLPHCGLWKRNRSDSSPSTSWRRQSGPGGLNRSPGMSFRCSVSVKMVDQIMASAAFRFANPLPAVPRK